MHVSTHKRIRNSRKRDDSPVIRRREGAVHRWPLNRSAAPSKDIQQRLEATPSHVKPLSIAAPHAQGFTLIEAMIVVVVLGILAAIAIPNYSRYVTRGNLVEATNALAEYRVRMEQFYQDNRTYANAGNCGVPAPTNLTTFAVACAIGGGGQAYTATATGAANTAGFVYTVDQANVRATTAVPAHWGSLPADAATRWVTR